MKNWKYCGYKPAEVMAAPDLLFKPIQIKPIVKEALKFLQASLPTSIEIQQDIQSDALVMADPTQIIDDDRILPI